MNVLIAVIEDLLSFALSPFSSLFRSETPSRASSDITPKAGAEEVLKELDELLEEAGEEHIEEVSTFRSTADLLGDSVPVGTEKNTVMYIGGAETPVFTHPTHELDGVIARLSYGTMLILLENKGRWSKVVHDGVTGWVLREELVDRAAYVYPDFTVGAKNEVDDPNTIRLRAMISDEYAGATAHLSLQSGEYIHYKLMRKGLTIPWKDERPRTPGKWHMFLKGRNGVVIGVRPKTGAILEYTMPNGLGHLTFVEAVFPDETVHVSEVNYPDDGIYNERVMTKEEWLELGPVFIQIT